MITVLGIIYWLTGGVNNPTMFQDMQAWMCFCGKLDLGLVIALSIVGVVEMLILRHKDKQQNKN